MSLKGLYAITDERLTPHDTILEQCNRALRAGVAVLQYRNKTQNDDDVEAVCVTLQRLCRTYGALFVIDDRPRLAARIGADGLHIGKDDLPLREAREIFPSGIIGVSCYGSVSKALEAQREGADYVAFGSFFPSPTKPRSGVVPLAVLDKAKAALTLPICAIGGINAENISRVAAHRPDLISVVSALWNGDVEANVGHLIQGMIP